MPQEVQLPKGGFNPSMFAAMKGDIAAPAAEPVKPVTPESSKPAPKPQPDFSAEIEENLKKHEESLTKKEPPKKEEKKPDAKEQEKGNEVPEEDEEEDEKPAPDEGEQEEEDSTTDTEGEGDDGEPAPRTLDIKGRTTPKAQTEQQELEEFPEELKPFAKQMARPARQKMLAELKKRDKMIEESKSATTHPLLVEGAYQLDNNYQQSAKVAQAANNELAYWKAQRAAIRNGNDWQNLQVNAEGKLIQIPQKASQEAEDFVSEKIAEASSLVRQHSATMSYIQNNYKNIVTEGLKGVAQVEDQLFPQFKDEKTIKGHPHHKAIQSILAQKGMVHLVPSSLFTKLYLAAQDAFDRVDELEGKSAKASVETEEESETETPKPKPQPTSKNFKGGVGKKKFNADGPGFDANAFERIKNR